MAIGIQTHRTVEDLSGKSHWWGFPDLPEGTAYPVRGETDEDGLEDTLTFICQIRLEDIAAFDKENMLPHKGMLYFFADLDYFLGDLEAEAQHLGFWDSDAFRVIYSPETDNLHTHRVQWEDGSDACPAPEEITFSEAPDNSYGHRLLGIPYYEETAQEAPGHISLLQIDEDDSWGLRLYDLGNLNFLISPAALAASDFTKAQLYFHCL